MEMVTNMHLKSNKILKHSSFFFSLSSSLFFFFMNKVDSSFALKKFLKAYQQLALNLLAFNCTCHKPCSKNFPMFLAPLQMQGYLSSRVCTFLLFEWQTRWLFLSNKLIFALTMRNMVEMTKKKVLLIDRWDWLYPESMSTQTSPSMSLCPRGITTLFPYGWEWVQEFPLMIHGGIF